MASEGQAQADSGDAQAKKRYLDPHIGGGPHGLGDPDDMSLRVVEKDICIPQKMKAKAKVHCKSYMDAFAQCAKDQGLLLPFKCRTIANEMGDCLRGWYQNEEFVKECTEEYLKERSVYRRTGITTKARKAMEEEAAQKT